MKRQCKGFSALIGAGVVAALVGGMIVAQPTPAKADGFAIEIGHPYYHHPYWHHNWRERDWRWRHDRHWHRDWR